MKIKSSKKKSGKGKKSTSSAPPPAPPTKKEDDGDVVDDDDDDDSDEEDLIASDEDAGKSQQVFGRVARQKEKEAKAKAEAEAKKAAAEAAARRREEKFGGETGEMFEHSVQVLCNPHRIVTKILEKHYPGLMEVKLGPKLRNGLVQFESEEAAEAAINQKPKKIYGWECMVVPKEEGPKAPIYGHAQLLLFIRGMLYVFLTEHFKQFGVLKVTDLNVNGFILNLRAQVSVTNFLNMGQVDLLGFKYPVVLPRHKQKKQQQRQQAEEEQDD